MFDNATILSCLKPLLGWSESSDPCTDSLFELSDEIQSSESGLYYNDVHPLLTIENLGYIAPDFQQYITNTQDYNGATSYSTGDRVEYNGSLYESLVDANLGNDPDVSPIEWEEVLLFSDWLDKGDDASILKLVNYLISKKKIRKDTKSLLDDLKLFDGNGRLSDIITKQGRFVGLQVELKRHEGLQYILRRIGIQANALQTDLPIYVYHSSQLDPVFTFNISTTKATSFEWINLEAEDINLKYFDESYDAGGVWYIGYYEDDLNGQAIRKNYNFSNTPCSKCNRYNYRAWSLYNRFLSIVPIQVTSGKLNGTQMFDLQDVQHVQVNNFGLNLSFSTGCDISTIFCDNKERFVDAIGKQRAVDLLKSMVHNTRNNNLSEDVKAMAFSALNGEDNIQSMERQIEDALDAIDFDFSDLDTPCLPCNNKSMVKISGI